MGTTEALAAVVVIIRFTGTVVVEEVNVTVAGLKAQLPFGGKFEHIEDKSETEPEKPFCALKVRVVDPDCPGLATLIVVGFAVIVKVPPTSMEVASEVDPW